MRNSPLVSRLPQPGGGLARKSFPRVLLVLLAACQGVKDIAFRKTVAVAAAGRQQRTAIVVRCMVFARPSGQISLCKIPRRVGPNPQLTRFVSDM